MKEEDLKQNISADKKPNLGLAILAALGLGLVGCALYGVLYYVGYIAWIASYVTILAAAWGYKHFNKKMDKKGYLIVAIVSIIGLLIAMFIALTLVIVKEFNSSFTVAIKDLFVFLDTNTKLRNYVIRDGALTAVFTLLGLLSYFFYEKRLEKATKLEAEQAPVAPAKEKKEEPKQEEVVVPAKVEEEKQPAKTTKQPQTTKTTATAKTKTAPAKKQEEVKAEAVAPETKKVEAAPTEPKEKPAPKRQTQKKVQTVSANKPLVIKPVVSAKPRTTTKKTTSKK